MTESVSDNYTKKNFSLLMAETGVSTFTTSLFTVLILWISISETFIKVWVIRAFFIGVHAFKKVRR